MLFIVISIAAWLYCSRSIIIININNIIIIISSSSSRGLVVLLLQHARGALLRAADGRLGVRPGARKTLPKDKIRLDITSLTANCWTLKLCYLLNLISANILGAPRTLSSHV